MPFPLAFIDCDVLSGSTSKVLQELLLRPDSRHAHLDFLLTRMVFQTTIAKHFDCASIQFREVCKKSLGKRLLYKLFSFGMTVSPDDVAHAVELLPDTKIATLDVIAANCQGLPRESLSLAYQMAVKLNKPQLLECLVKRGGAPPETPQVLGTEKEGGGREREGERGREREGERGREREGERGREREGEREGGGGEGMERRGSGKEKGSRSEREGKWEIVKLTEQ